MPELPEVETMRRGLFPVVGGTIEEIEIPRIPYRPISMTPSIATFRRRAVGQTISQIDRIAKRVLVRLSSGDAIVMQPKMAGIAMLSDPPSEQHCRVIFHVSNAVADRFLYWDRRGLGSVHLWSSSEVEQFLGPDVLGPDALAIEVEDFIARFSQLDRAVKVALLDQRLVAGVGNLYASEILHQASVHPESRCREIARKDWKKIFHAMIAILNNAIEMEGSTLSDGTYRNAVNGEGSYQMQHKVYDRADEACVSCKKGKIVRIVQAQRSTFYCNKCQKK